MSGHRGPRAPGAPREGGAYEDSWYQVLKAQADGAGGLIPAVVGCRPCGSDSSPAEATARA